LLINVQVPDEIYQKYADRSPERPQKALADTLKAFADLDPAEAKLIISGATLKELNRLLEWPIDSEKILLERIGKYKRVAVPKLGLSLELSEAQLSALKSQADFWNSAGKANAAELMDFCRKQLMAGIAKVVGP
jgi:hypothetical protein